MRLLSSSPLPVFQADSIQSIAQFNGTYKPNPDSLVFRLVTISLLPVFSHDIILMVILRMQ
jgi:hypothetical protein